MPYEERKLYTPLDVSIRKERQGSESSKNRIGVEPSWVGSKIGAKVNLATEKTGSQTDKFEFISAQISMGSQDDNPAWEFEVKTGEPILKGMLKKTELGTLTVTGKPCDIEATFEISRRNIIITDRAGVFGKDIFPEKREAIEIVLVKALLKKKIKNHLSQIKLQYV